jgi:hypothetical protein
MLSMLLLVAALPQGLGKVAGCPNRVLVVKLQVGLLGCQIYA